MKPTILLTIALFLASAPAPDSKTISEISAGFLLPNNEHGLMASVSGPNLEAKPGISARLDALVVIQPDTQAATQATTEQ